MCVIKGKLVEYNRFWGLANCSGFGSISRDIMVFTFSSAKKSETVKPAFLIKAEPFKK